MSSHVRSVSRDAPLSSSHRRGGAGDKARRAISTSVLTTPILLGFGGSTMPVDGDDGGHPRTLSIVDIENAEEDELRPLRSMSVA